MSQIWEPLFHHQNVKVIDEKEVYSGYCPIKEYRLQFTLFAGGMSEPIIRELILRPGAAAVLLYNPKEDKVVLIEQLRLGALEEEESPWVLDVVAGVIDLGETNESTAYRESIEEAGCEIKTLMPICSYLVSVGISNEKTSVYCGLIDQLPRDGALHGLGEHGEDIKVHVMSREEAWKLFQQGKIKAASAVIALQWLMMNYSSL